MHVNRLSTRSAPRPVRKWIAAAVWLTLFLVCARLPLSAQERVVSGVVVAGESLQPLPNAQVGILGTTITAITDPAGHFVLRGVAGADAEVTVSLIGYRPFKQQVRVGATNVRFSLTLAPIELNQIVITGTAGAAQKRSVG